MKNVDINKLCGKMEFRQRVKVAEILGVIENDFNGHVPLQNLLNKRMKEKYGWGNKTTRRKLEQLEELGLLIRVHGPSKLTKGYVLKDV